MRITEYFTLDLLNGIPNRRPTFILHSFSGHVVPFYNLLGNSKRNRTLIPGMGKVGLVLRVVRELTPLDPLCTEETSLTRGVYIIRFSFYRCRIPLPKLTLEGSVLSYTTESLCSAVRLL